MLKKIFLLFNTVSHLKIRQLRYQFLYRLRNPGSLKRYKGFLKEHQVPFPDFTDYPPVYQTAREDNTFCFLNITVAFGLAIDWAYDKHGKLWNYNLQYCNYLLQQDITVERRVEWLKDLYSWLMDGRLKLEPYPASLRTINAIRFFSTTNIIDKELLGAVHAEFNYLHQNPEYHILGNHLLENAFALLMGGAFFAEKEWTEQGKRILAAELEEQILSDGAHFELSPMYHQIILFRLLELIDWYSKWQEKDEEFLTFLSTKAALMMGWLEQISFPNHDIPHLNDSAPGIAYAVDYLLDYSARLGLVKREVKLQASGYRKFSLGDYACVVDVAEIGPAYQPGHGHADALSFILYTQDCPVLVEWGTSTYQIGERRSLERSTAAHNTVVVGAGNQSEVWGGFRVARRAGVMVLKDRDTMLEASHNGYESMGYTHCRNFTFEEKLIAVTDRVKKINQSVPEKEKLVYFHIHPERRLKLEDNKAWIDDNIRMEFYGASAILLEEYNMADGFNRYTKGLRIKVAMDEMLRTNIYFN